MINLFTGATGCGKTTYVVSELIALIEEGRPLYVHGIPELAFPHTVVICDSPICKVCPKPPVEPIEPQKPNFDAHSMLLKQYAIDLHNYTLKQNQYIKEFDIYNSNLFADQWHKWAPDGALILYDEVQFVYPPVSGSAKQKDSVVLFSTHRHMGLDFYLMTQTPLLFDRAVKLLCGKHIHIRSTWMGRFQYEFDQVQDNVKSLSTAIRSKYKLNKKAFSMFKSSSLHTKQKRKTPAAAFALVALVLVFGFLSFSFSSRLSAKITPDQTVVKNDITTNDINSPTNSTKLASINPTKQLQYKLDDLPALSFTGINIDNIQKLPKYCKIHTNKSFKCYFPEDRKKQFKSSVCFSYQCYTIISIKTEKNIQLVQSDSF